MRRIGALRAWLDDIQPFAYGTLGLKPWELLAYTPREFGALVEGWQRQQERERFARAELAVWLIAPHITKPITVKDLLGNERREDL